MKRVLFFFMAVAVTACWDNPAEPPRSEMAAGRSPRQIPEGAIGGPIAEALYLLPPVGKAAPEPPAADTALTDYLWVSVCEVEDGPAPTEVEANALARDYAKRARIRPAAVAAQILQAVGALGCEEVWTSTSTRQDGKLDYVARQGDQYHVNWKVDAQDVGKQLMIRFETSNLIVVPPRPDPASTDSLSYLPADSSIARALIAGFAFTPRTPATLPLRFRVAPHPWIRARIRRLEGFTLPEVASALIGEFGESQVSAGTFTGYMASDLVQAYEIAAALRDGYGLGAAEAVAILQAHFDAAQIARPLIDAYQMDAGSLVTALIDAGFNASEVYNALITQTDLPRSEIIALLSGLGLTGWLLDRSEGELLAEKFAPLLQITYVAPCDAGWDSDGNMCSFPMTPQLYYDSIIKTGIWKQSRESLISAGYDDPRWHPMLANMDPSTLLDPVANDIPTYWRAWKAADSEQVRIEYWWFWGWQNRCLDDETSWFGSGQHHGDWEKVLITTTEDRSSIAAISFGQHGGWYTRLSGGFETTSAGRPVVYVGKYQHGLYRDAQTVDLGMGGINPLNCMPLWDHREPNASIETQLNLKSLADEDEPWMAADVVGGFGWGWCPGGDCSTETNPLASNSGEHPTRIANEWELDNFLGCNTSACDDSKTEGLSCLLESQCLTGDTDFFGCWHCAPGYTDMGPLGCWDWDCFIVCWPNDVKWFKYYWYDYTMPRSNAGLMYMFPGWTLPS